MLRGVGCTFDAAPSSINVWGINAIICHFRFIWEPLVFPPRKPQRAQHKHTRASCTNNGAHHGESPRCNGTRQHATARNNTQRTLNETHRHSTEMQRPAPTFNEPHQHSTNRTDTQRTAPTLNEPQRHATGGGCWWTRFVSLDETWTDCQADDKTVHALRWRVVLKHDNLDTSKIPDESHIFCVCWFM